MASSIQRPSFRRQWLLPAAALAIAALAVFWGLWTLDNYVTGGPATAHPAGAIDRYLHFDPDHITDAVSALSGMDAGVLGLVITVVSIIVQLSADRYTGVARSWNSCTC